MTDLPEGWALATIKELIAGDGLFVDGDWVETKDQDPGGEVRLTQLADVGDGAWRNRSDRYLTTGAADRLGCTPLEANDVLVARMPDPLGRACLFPGDPRTCVTVVDVAIVRPGDGSVSPNWLMWAINAPGTRTAIEAQQAGTTRKRVSRRNLGEIVLPIAPRAEQTRIVAAIEEAFSKLDAGEAGLRAVRQLLKRMRDAVLAAAVTGRLVPQDPTDTPAAKLLADLGVEVRTSPALADLPAGWAPSVLGDVADWSSGGTPNAGTARYYGGAIPWAVIGDLTEGPVWKTASSLTDDGLAESSAKIVPEGTVLLAMYGASIGRIGVAASAMATNQAIACARPRPEVLAGSYLFWFLRSQRSAFVEQGKGAAQPNISQSILKGWPIAVPPVDEQLRIVVEVDRQFSFLDACERAVDVSLARAAALRRSVLRTAFEGRLVRQDPADEPAPELLERIRAERAAAPTPARRTRRTA